MASRKKIGHSWQCSKKICKKYAINSIEQPTRPFTPVLEKNKINISINSKSVECLIDTGADISCISKFLLKSVAPNVEIKRSSLMTIVGACGERHPVLGTVELEFNCEEHSFKQIFHVFEHLQAKIILGVDFLIKNSVTVKFGEVQVPIENHNGITCATISTEKVLHQQTELARPVSQTIVPPHSEHSFQVKINGFADGSTILIEPMSNILGKNQLSGCKTLCTVNNGQARFRVLNPTELPVLLSSKLAIGKAQLVDNDLCFDFEEETYDINISNIDTANSNLNLTYDKNLVNELGINLDNNGILTETQKLQTYNLLARNRDIFAKDLSEIGETTLHTHEIYTKQGARPVSSGPYRLSPEMRKVLDGELDEMKRNGFITESNTPWHSPVVMVKKPNGEWRVCIDYRKLNEITEPMSYPIPHMTDVFDTLAESKATIYSTLDLRSGFWQVPLGEETKHKSGFITHRGVFEFNRLSFGMTNAPMTFQALMSKVLRNLNYKIALVYIDDILIFSKTFAEHIHHLDTIFNNLRQANLKLHPTKCKFATTSVKYLGHIISKDGLTTSPENIEKIMKAKSPKSAKEIKRFLGMAGYYRKFVKDYSKISQPLQDQLKKNVKFQWTQKCEIAFQTLKEKLTSAPILKYPDFDKPFVLSTDSSEYAIGYVLTQEYNKKEHPISFGGRSLRENELKWHITDKEGLALVEGIQHFKHYLANKHFIIYTDNIGIKYLQKIQDCQGRLGRWSILLQGYDFEIRHRAGAANHTADFLSRQEYSSEQTKYSTDLADHIGSVSASTKTYIQTSFQYPDEPDVVVSPITAIQDPPDNINIDTISNAQQSCCDLQHLYKYLKTREVPDNEKLARAVAAESYNYIIENQVLYHFHTKRNKNRPQHERIVKCIAIPRKLRDDLLKSYHDCLIGGVHQGSERTYEALRSKYFWRSMYTDVRQYIQSCEVCQQSKRAFNSKPPPLHPQPVDDIFSRWHMDILSGLPTTKEKYKHILLVVDSYSKWCECFPLKTQEAPEVAAVLYREIISRYGAPRTLISDRGRNFMSHLVNALSELFQIKRSYTSSYHPQTNGLVESKNSFILQSFRAYCKNQQDDWPEYLPGIMMAYRSTPATQSTDYSPFFMLFGREMRLPIDTVLQPKDHLSPDIKLNLARITQNVEICRKLAGENIQRSQDKYKKQYDKWSKLPSYRPAQRVWLYCTKVPPGKAPKLHRKWVGPYYITLVGPNHTYKVRHQATNKEVQSLVNAKRLKPYYDPEERQTNIPDDLHNAADELDPDQLNDNLDDDIEDTDPAPDNTSDIQQQPATNCPQHNNQALQQNDHTADNQVEQQRQLQDAATSQNPINVKTRKPKIKPRANKSSTADKTKTVASKFQPQQKQHTIKATLPMNKNQDKQPNVKQHQIHSNPQASSPQPGPSGINKTPTCPDCKEPVCLKLPTSRIQQLEASKRQNGKLYYKVRFQDKEFAWYVQCRVPGHLKREFHASKALHGKKRKRPLQQHQHKFFNQVKPTVNYIQKQSFQQNPKINRKRKSKQNYNQPFQKYRSYNRPHFENQPHHQQYADIIHEQSFASSPFDDNFQAFEEPYYNNNFQTYQHPSFNDPIPYEPQCQNNFEPYHDPPIHDNYDEPNQSECFQDCDHYNNHARYNQVEDYYNNHASYNQVEVIQSMLDNCAKITKTLDILAALKKS